MKRFNYDANTPSNTEQKDMVTNYILDGHKAVKCSDLMRWAVWFKNANRMVASETIGKSRVSTVFLGIDHGFGEGKPLLFETMVFGGDGDGAQDRCSTWEEAEKGHKKACLLAFKRKGLRQMLHSLLGKSV